MSTGRAEAFSDGVFAVAITVLVFGLLPIGAGKQLDATVLLLLMGIVAIPFPTALVAEHLRNSGGKLATVTYGLVMIAISAGFAALWVYVATHAAALGATLPPEALRSSLTGWTLGGAVYVAGTLIAAFVSAVAGMVIFGALAVYYLFEHLPSPAEDATGSSAEPGP